MARTLQSRTDGRPTKLKIRDDRKLFREFRRPLDAQEVIWCFVSNIERDTNDKEKVG
jgi:hypothetical protein